MGVGLVGCGARSYRDFVDKVVRAELACNNCVVRRREANIQALHWRRDYGRIQ